MSQVLEIHFDLRRELLRQLQSLSSKNDEFVIKAEQLLWSLKGFEFIPFRKKSLPRVKNNDKTKSGKRSAEQAFSDCEKLPMESDKATIQHVKPTVQPLRSCTNKPWTWTIYNNPGTQKFESAKENPAKSDTFKKDNLLKKGNLDSKFYQDAEMNDCNGSGGIIFDEW